MGFQPATGLRCVARESAWPVRELAGGASGAAFREWLRPRCAPGARAWIASVQRPAVTAAVVDALQELGIATQALNPPSGLALALRRPETCGLDRQLAARAALAASGAPVVVVSAGTALTVDAAVPADDPRGVAAFERVVGRALPARAAGVFLGGAIAPGPRLAAEALARGGARLFGVEGFSPDAPALGVESEAALRAGVVHGFIGAARELARAVARAADLEGAAVWLTGGAAHLVARALAEDVGPAFTQDAGLVLTGLALVGEEEQPWPM